MSVIKSHQKYSLVDAAGKNHMEAEINFDPKDDSKVKLIMGDKVCFVSRRDIYSLALFTSNEEDFDSLMPTRVVDTREIVKVHIVEAKKDIKKGEKIKMRCRINVPIAIYDGLAATLGKDIGKTKIAT